MALVNVSIGAAENAFAYDDADTYADGTTPIGALKVSSAVGNLAEFDDNGVLRETTKKASDIGAPVAGEILLATTYDETDIVGLFADTYNPDYDLPANTYIP